jgi:hypothetical protein
MAAMRSLFSTLKARRILFTSPAAPLASRALQPPPVLPLDDTQRARLPGLADEPGQRLIMLLAGVHALRPSQICALTLDAVGPGAATLLISGQARPLGQLTVQHLRAWLHTRRHGQPLPADQPQHRRRRQAHRPQLRAGHLPPGRPHRRRAARRPAS